MIEVIFRNGGTLDKFLGDGVMVVFGAPMGVKNQEEAAIKTALEMKEELNNLCDKWETEGKNRISIGIGINTGNAIAGNIGSSERMEYTVIGDTVNIASRMETAAKELGEGIIISEYTYNAVRGLFDVQSKGQIHVKGRETTIAAYSVLGNK